MAGREYEFGSRVEQLAVAQLQQVALEHEKNEVLKVDERASEVEEWMLRKSRENA